jgi:hypothetical protein
VCRDCRAHARVACTAQPTRPPLRCRATHRRRDARLPVHTHSLTHARTVEPQQGVGRAAGVGCGGLAVAALRAGDSAWCGRSATGTPAARPPLFFFLRISYCCDAAHYCPAARRATITQVHSTVVRCTPARWCAGATLAWRGRATMRRAESARLIGSMFAASLPWRPSRAGTAWRGPRHCGAGMAGRAS